MTIVVSFVKPVVTGVSPGIGIGEIRKREDIALNGTTTTTAEAGEFILVGNAEGSMVVIAFGSIPDADQATADDDSSAGLSVPAGQNSEPLVAKAGDKVNAKAVT